MKDVNLSSLANGALEERFNDELQKVLKNVRDPNTHATKPRKIQLTVLITPTEDRDELHTKYEIKSTLVPARQIESTFILDEDDDGNAVAAEVTKGQVRGQMTVEQNGSIEDDAKIVNLRKRAN